jgi:hypothetical protein
MSYYTILYYTNYTMLYYTVLHYYTIVYNIVCYDMLLYYTIVYNIVYYNVTHLVKCSSGYRRGYSFKTTLCSTYTPISSAVVLIQHWVRKAWQLLHIQLVTQSNAYEIASLDNL